MIRIGHGFDVHKFGGEGPVIIGGVSIDYEMGLVAHSDGDVLLHAISDAILGAMALGDIGHHFPDNDDAYEGADSRELLRQCFAQAEQNGYVLGNLDATIVAQAPKMAPYIEQMKQHLAEDLKCGLNQVNVKATTTERLGYTGRKEGIAAHAVVLLQR
ncbi:2-C-methyl-D-erythritol 2,4-cyclodiphosphate synthase [Neiella marina]|uniref:2-C-methyl-D-erythritol 2,4-cyclodiphosphate synthase n=1 Tax=Neiella marina TaxID=508461 RepID=A0A8J2U4H8_9GAMM|nr:2-C-methyl-D-erythritol 2,4-cyclodiphosphate synthase [Neiella marina]GGA74852.1 2-C-methyl-D-erythritol 2,4-cyclodiphosphate synthase [Neiella marina]